MAVWNPSNNSLDGIKRYQRNMGITSGSWMDFLTALGGTEGSHSYNPTHPGYDGIYQFASYTKSDSIFYTLDFSNNFGNMLGATTDASFRANPIAQELAAIMEFSGIPGKPAINKNFSSQYASIRNALGSQFQSQFDQMVIQNTFTINWTDGKDANGKDIVVLTQEIKLTPAGLSAAAHLIGATERSKGSASHYFWKNHATSPTH